MRIEPKILKGFRDFLPAEAAVRKKIIHTLEEMFESFAFQPIDTPVLEYTEVLLGKGGGETDKQVYRFLDQGKRDVSMRFDLTVPFARFMGKNENLLTIPFKRYHIDKVWRGENTQRGRYREFTQCDFDIVGTTAVSADLEILLIMYRAFEALGISDITIKINHRGVFNRFLNTISVADHATEIMRSIDKIGKIGASKVRELLCESISAGQADAVLAYIQPKDSFLDTLDTITALAGGEAEDTRRLKQLHDGFTRLGIEGKIFLDSSIMRGLDYYTGIVYETFFNELPQIGSVCSGGRYDNLASLYTKTELPGVGSSIGLDRLVAALEELGEVNFEEKSADVAVFCIDENIIGYYHRIAEALRKHGLRCDVFYEKKKIGQQFKFAERKHIPVVIICGDEEMNTDTVSMKDIVSGTAFDKISVDDAAAHILDILNKNSEDN